MIERLRGDSEVFGCGLGSGKESPAGAGVGEKRLRLRRGEKEKGGERVATDKKRKARIQRRRGQTSVVGVVHPSSGESDEVAAGWELPKMPLEKEGEMELAAGLDVSRFSSFER